MTEIVTVVAVLEARPGKEQELEQELRRLIGPTRAEAGCLNYDLHQSRENAGTFVFLENWCTGTDLEAHFKTPHIQAFRAKADGLLSRPLDVKRLQRIG